MRLPKRIAYLVLATMMLAPAIAQRASAQDTIRVPAKPPVWGTSVKLTPVFSIGAVDGPDEYAFGRVEGFAVAANGTMYVFDQQDGQIRSYDATGKFLRNIGRKGAGPGEYRWVAGMDVTADSVLVTMDISNARVTYFAPSGKVIRSFNDARISSTGGHDMVVDNAGLVNMEIRSGDGEVPLAAGVPAAQGKRVMRFNQAGKLVDALVMPRAMATPRTFFLQSPDGGNTNFQARSASASLRSGGYVFGNGDILRLIIHPGTGPTRVVERNLPKLNVLPDERANWQEWATHFERQDQGKITYAIPATKPAWRDLLTDNDSRIWVSLYAPAQKITLPPRPANKTGPRLYWQQPATYDVFSGTGEYLGRVGLPMRSKVVAAKGNRVVPGERRGRRGHHSPVHDLRARIVRKCKLATRARAPRSLAPAKTCRNIDELCNDGRIHNHFAGAVVSLHRNTMQARPHTTIRPARLSYNIEHLCNGPDHEPSRNPPWHPRHAGAPDPRTKRRDAWLRNRRGN